MKQFKFLAMALLAMVMSVGFVACSSDDDDDNNGGGSVTSGKKLMSITEGDENETFYTITFDYNSNGQLIKAGETDNPYISLDWTSNSIILKDNEESSVNITLKDNKVKAANSSDHSSDTSFKYSGNSLPNFIEYESKESAEYNHKITWENGNITKTEDGEGNINVATYYEDKVNKHPTIDITALNLDDAIPAEYGELLYLAHPSLFGSYNKNLLKSVTSKGETVNYSYELDKDGYPTKITETVDNHTNTIYTLTWK